MKKKELIKQLKKNGYFKVREGSNHEVWCNQSGNMTTIPRHREIKEYTAKSILKYI